MANPALHDLWTAPDNSRLSSKQFSFRLPIHVAAQILALEELYPQRNRTQIVADLLTSALKDLEQNLPEGLGKSLEMALTPDMAKDIESEIGEEVFELGGIRGSFHKLANKHFQELEKDLGNETPGRLFGDYWITKSQLNKK